MNRYNYPPKERWQALTTRPTIAKEALDEIVTEVLNNVKKRQDAALFNYTQRFDGIALKQLRVSKIEIEKANQTLADELKKAIQTAKNNIEKFHASQQIQESVIETTKGVQCWRKSVAIEKVGLYIPGGTAPLFSTILMLGVPARLARCQEVILCTPPNKHGEIHPAILYTATLLGIDTIYKVGGAQAIAAMAYGTESIPQVYKIFGPGNQYVTKAKELVQLEGIAIDMPAGPSEVLVLADSTANPAFVAADLLSQAEHGVDSQVVLVADNQAIIEKTINELNQQVEKLPRKKIAQKALENSLAILLKDRKECISFSNAYAPEHLIIASDNAMNFVDEISNAGSVFLGNYSCESAGDYASGTNHTLPTNGFARTYSGVSLDSFVKKITFQQLTQEGIQNIGHTIEIMAEAEGLFAHKNAVTLRLKSLNDV